MRRTMLVGTALGCTIGIAPAAFAQNVTYNGPGPYTLTRTDTVSGGPRTVDVTVTSEDVVLDLTQVEVANSTNTIGAGIAATNTGPGNTTVRNGSVTATGTGSTNAIDARATTGAISVTSTGTITATAGTSRGINAPTGNGGNITIVANVVNGATRGISTGAIDAAGSAALFATSQVSITSNTVTATGAGTVNAILGQGNRVVINAGTTSNTNAAGNQGVALLANAGSGGVLINAGTTSALGQNQAALQVFSGGVVDVTSGTIRTTQNSDGLSIQTGTDIVVRSTAITTEGTGGARGIVLGGASGGGSLNGGPNGIIYTSATLTSGSISTVGAGAFGIYATPNGAGTTTINSGAITTTGANATGIFVTPIGAGTISGAITVNSTGALTTSGANAFGINVVGGTGPVTVNNSGTMSVTGALTDAIRVQNGAGTTTIASNRIDTGTGTGINVFAEGAVAITSGTIARTAATGTAINVVGGFNTGTLPTSVTIASTAISGGNMGINVNSTGNLSVTSGTIALTSAATGSTTALNATGIFVNGVGAVAINSGSLSFTGSGNTAGIQGQNNATTGGTLNITSGSVSVIGNGGYGILGSSQSAAIAINSTGTVTTTGTTRQAGGTAGIANSRFADGILAYSQSGSVSITNAGAIDTSGNAARGISVETGRAIQSFGPAATTASTAAISITNSGSITTRGAVGANNLSAVGISVLADTNPIAITSNAIATSGASAHGMFIRPGAGIASTGPVSITSGTITTGGTSALGILMTGADGFTINSGAITTTGTGVSTGIQVAAIAASANPVSITSGTINVTNAASSGNGIVVTASSTGATTINSGAITIAGSGGGIAVQSTIPVTGNVTINSGDITLSAPPSQAFRTAMNIFQTAGTTTINSTGTIQSGGNGIFVQARSGQTAGAVNINSNIINAAATAILVGTGSAVTINAANTATTGATQTAISVAPSVGGTVSINAGTVTTTGTTAVGVGVFSNTAGVTNIAVGTANTTGSAVDARTAGALTVASGTARIAGGTSTGLTAISSGGDVTLTSTDLAVTNGRGIFAQGRDNAVVTSGTLASTGADTALFAQTSFGQGAGTLDGIVTVNSTTLTSTGGGINAAGPRAVVVVNSGTLTSGNATGIGAFGPTSTINSGTLTSQGAGIFASFDTNGTRRGLSTVNSETVFIDGTVDATSVAVAANNQSVTINSGSIVSTGLGNRIGISAQAIGGTALPGDIAITSRDIVTVGNGAYGIQAIASAGAVTINSTGTITTVGTTRLAGTQPRYSAGIIAVAQNGAIAVTSNNLTTSGAQSDGVRVEAGAGIVSYTQGTIGVAPTAVTTTGLTQTAGTDAAGINVLGGGGAVTVVNTGTIATAGDGAAGIIVAAREGATTLTSNVITTTGAGATGIRVAGTAGAATITAVATTTTGAGANAIDARFGGAVTVDSTTASATGGDGILVQSGGLATVRATTARGGGDGGSGVFVTGTGVVLNVGSASSTGATVTDANGVVTRADAIFAEATTDAITAQLGSASATGAGSDAVRLVANGANGAVTATVTGTLNSAGGYGLFIDPPGAVNVSIVAGARVTGAIGGIFGEGGSVAITNAGTISSTGGVAIATAGPTTIDNSGTIAGAGATAVQLTTANDTVILRTGSTITGTIVGGGGTDAALLIGTGNAPMSNQTLASFAGFDSLTVQSGYWTAPATAASTVARTIVNGGAVLELQNGGAGIAGYATGSIADNGLLVVRSSASSAGSTFGATTVTGSGNVTFTGPGLVTLNGMSTLANTGTNLIEGGTVLVTGTQGGNFVTGTAGTLQVGDGGTTGLFTGNLANNGTLVVSRSTDIAFNGGLTGAGVFVKEGAGRITFGSGYAFTGVTQLNGGAIRLTTTVAPTTELDLRGNGQVDFSGTNQTIAELQGPSALASINIAGGSLTVNQATSTSFAGSIVGAGTLTKTGTGTLNLTGNSTYAGPTAVNGGRLLVNGSITSPVTVNSGGTLGGTGTVGSATIVSGGRWAPGNSIGTQAVTGNVSFGPGSIFEVEANAAGAADRINATGTATLTGGTVQVLAEAGTYARQTNYTILTASGGVSGRFTNVTSNFAFLSPALGYTANAVTLTLARNDLSFGAVAAGGNQSAVANAVFARGSSDPLFNAILFQSAAGAQASFTALGGELNAGLATELTDNGRRVRQAVLDRGAVAAEPGVALWAHGLQSTAQSDINGGRARLSANRTGVIGGLDYVTTGGIRVGAFGGYQDDDITLRGRASTADVQTRFAGASIAHRSGRLSIQAGGLYAWHDVDTSRSLAGAGLGTVQGRFDANSAQLFAEAGYALTDGPAVVTPFLRHAATRTRVDAFTETGGLGALSVRRDEREIGLASAGLRLDGTASIGSATFLPRMSIAYQRAYGDIDGIAVQRFGGTGPAFAVSGAGLGKDGLTVDGGFDLAVGGFSLGAGGFASTSNRWKDYGAKASIGLRF